MFNSNEDIQLLEHANLKLQLYKRIKTHFWKYLLSNLYEMLSLIIISPHCIFLLLISGVSRIPYSTSSSHAVCFVSCTFLFTYYPFKSPSLISVVSSLIIILSLLFSHVFHYFIFSFFPFIHSFIHLPLLHTFHHQVSLPSTSSLIS